MEKKGPYAICEQESPRWACATVQSWGILCLSIYYSTLWFCKRAKKAQVSLCKCAGWSGPVLSANGIRTLFVHCASLAKKYNLWAAPREEVLRACAKCAGYHNLIRAFALQRNIRIQWFRLRTGKALIRLCGCAGWSGPSLFAYARRHGFFFVFFFVLFCFLHTARRPM